MRFRQGLTIRIDRARPSDPSTWKRVGRVARLGLRGSVCAVRAVCDAVRLFRPS
ncbi:hypothetical protein FLHKCMKP_CDS0080 [Escherichia phage KS_A3]